MERTFGVKDFVLFGVLSLVIVLILLAMLQFDRQWNEVQNVKHKLEQQASDLQAIRQQIERGIAIGGPATNAPTTAASTVAPALARVAAARAKPDFAQGDWIVYGDVGNFASLTPMIGGDVNSSDVISNVLESLCARDAETLEWKGLLAETWTQQDNSAAWDAYAATRRNVPLTEADVCKEDACPPASDAAARKAYVDRRLKEGRNDDNIGSEADCPPAAVYTFTLRPNLTFSDGTPLTADDVVYTYDWIMNPAVNAPRDRSYLSRMRSVKKVGDREVAFAFRTPYFDAFTLAAGFQVMSKAFYGKCTPEQYNQSTGLLLGSGPYMMPDPAAWKPGTQLSLVRNPRYWGVQPGPDKLVYREFTNQVALETAFRNGEIDQIGCPAVRYVQMIKDKDLLARTQHYEYQSSTGGYGFLAWNQQRFGKDTLFTDKRVRQAMTLLTDTPRILSEIRLGYGVLATGPFNPVSKQNDSNLKPWPYDPERAFKLLADAGWKEQNGTLVNAQGQPFTFKLTYPTGNPSTDKMVLLLKDLYARAKIRMELDPQEWSVFKTRLENHEFDAITLAWSAGIEDDLFQIFHSSQISGGGDNFISYKDAELDQGITDARRTLDEPQRMTLWHKCHDLIYEDQPYTFLIYGKSLVFMDKRLANVQVTRRGLNADNEWYVPAGQQRWTK